VVEAYVVAADEVEGLREAGDTALVRVTIGAEQGCEHLEQRVVRFGPGRSRPRRDDERDEVLYVVSGTGTLLVDGEPHPLEPDTGAYVAAGETVEHENTGPDELIVVSVSAPAASERPGANRSRTVRFGWCAGDRGGVRNRAQSCGLGNHFTHWIDFSTASKAVCVGASCA